MHDLAWKGVVGEDWKGRGGKPRDIGVTMVIDTGLGVAATADVVEISGDYIDHWKCSFGTSTFVRTEVLRRKLGLLAASDILTYPGGTLLEAAIVNQHCRVFMSRAKKLGFNAAEISDGTIPMTWRRRKKVIQCARDNGLVAITEVGKKDPANQPTAAEIAEQALKDLDAGATWVIIEGRESGVCVGIYDDCGGIKEEALEEITSNMGDKADRLIWETPKKEQQAALVKRFGSNVGLGNICPQDMLALESLRAGLRFETLKPIADEWERTGRWNPDQVEQALKNNGNS
jgi:phosphosulfolactate synthase